MFSQYVLVLLVLKSQKLHLQKPLWGIRILRWNLSFKALFTFSIAFTPLGLSLLHSLKIENQSYQKKNLLKVQYSYPESGQRSLLVGYCTENYFVTHLKADCTIDKARYVRFRSF